MVGEGGDRKGKLFRASTEIGKAEFKILFESLFWSQPWYCLFKNLFALKVNDSSLEVFISLLLMLKG
jgi:hypothetical protein